MPPAPWPLDESERLNALLELGVLDTGPEERFDRITRTAQKLFNVPIVLVSLVASQRQWFKSCVGLDVSETSRETSFCAYTMQQAEALVVEDAFTDPRFSDNALVQGEPHIRFYAGHPLRGPRGHGLGSLCIIDRSPRKMTQSELESLRDLAAWVEEQLSNLALTEAVAELAASESRGRAVMNNVAEGIIVMLECGKIESTNLACARSLGITRATSTELLFPAFIIEPADLLPRIQQHFDQSCPSDPLRLEAMLRRSDASTFPVELSVTTATWDSSRRFVVAFRDITERRRLETLREDVIQMLVHDLKSPLSAILGFTELMLAHPLFEAESVPKTDLIQIHCSAEQMLEHVSSLLDVSRLEEGKMPLRVRVVDLTRLTREVVASLSSLADERIELALPPGIVSCACDPDLIGRVLSNLISNALKYTTLGARVELKSQPGLVRLTVIDQGQGIPPELQERIFQKFVQAQGSARHSSGLGLAFCKLAVEAHGGSLGVTSGAGRGSAFWFELPDNEAPQESKRLRILLADDSEFHRRLALRCLADHEVVVACDGHEAVSLWSQEACFDVLLLDLEMPGLSGIEAVKAIRLSESSRGSPLEGGGGGGQRGGRVPVIALTSHGLAAQAQCLELGMDACLSKPLSPDSLLAQIARLTRQRPAQLKLDRGRILLRMAGNEAVLAEVAGNFLELAPEHLKQIRRAVLELDPVTLQFEAHSLQGAICYFENGTAYEAARRLELLGRDRHLDGAEVYLAQLESALGPLRDAVQRLLLTPS